MNQILRTRIQHLVKVLSRRRLFLNARERKLLADGKKVLADNLSDAEIAAVVAEMTQEAAQ